MAVLLAVAVSGCATDQQRTKTGGAVLGTVAGAAAGAAAGLLLGVLSGNRDSVGKFVVAGATAGAVLGGQAGYRWGERVAYRKEQYKTSEDRMMANIRRASEVRTATIQENKLLRGQIADLHSRLGELAAGRGGQAFRAKLTSFVDTRRQDVTRKLGTLDNEIADRSQALTEDRAASPQRAVELQSQIGSLRAERSEMQQLNQQLAAIRPRIGV